jgi:hypothetical protein
MIAGAILLSITWAVAARPADWLGFMPSDCNDEPFNALLALLFCPVLQADA